MINTLDKRILSTSSMDSRPSYREAGILYALLTGKHRVSRRNRASWYLKQLNKLVSCDDLSELDEPDDNQSVATNVKLANDQRDQNLTEDEPDRKAEKEAQSKVETNFIKLASITSLNPSVSLSSINERQTSPSNNHIGNQKFSVTTNTKAVFLSRRIATSIILDLSPSVVSVSSQNNCVFLDLMFDSVKRLLNILVKPHKIPSSTDSESYILKPKVYITVIAYTPFMVAKYNQVLLQNRRIDATNVDQVLVEMWVSLTRLTQEVHELVSNTCGVNFNADTNRNINDKFVFSQTINGSVMRHPNSVLEDIFELGTFSSSLMPRLSRLSIVVITDGLLASSNNLNIFRLKGIALSFIFLGGEAAYPDSCLGYTPYIDLMKFISKTTSGVCLSHQDLINFSNSLASSRLIPLLSNPLYRLFTWILHSEICDESLCSAQTPSTIMSVSYSKTDLTSTDPIEVNQEQVARYFSIDQPFEQIPKQSSLIKSECYLNCDTVYNDWRSFKQLDCSLDADFEQVLACLLREGYLIKSIQFKRKETYKIVARLVLHWRYNLDLEQELTASYWNNNADPFDIHSTNQMIIRPFSAPLYGDTFCEVIVHGSYSFLHNMYCDRRARKRSKFREHAYEQFKQLIDGVMHTHERLQYLSRFYRNSSLSKIPSFLQHGNSLLYEQPHTHKLTTTVDNVMNEVKTSEFQAYWQSISCLDANSWTNLMHIHTLRLVLEHDQQKHKNIHCQNASGRYTHVQCRRALSAVSNFIKNYASFALLEDTTYIKFIYNKDDDLREIETSSTKGFIVIKINKLLPIIVIQLMFTSGILDSHRDQILSYLEEQLVNCKLRTIKTSVSSLPSTPNQSDNLLKAKTICPSSESCCILIRSPLESMLKVYTRNYVGEFLVNNWSHGLPGSCPHPVHPSMRINGSQVIDSLRHPRNHDNKERGGAEDENQNSGNFMNKYNVIFSKYLYGIRVIHTISNLPNEVVSLLANNVLSKISAILVNVRIKQGFYIAFNNSGIMNLVVEIAMDDPSNKGNPSNCLCQYVIFPPTICQNAQGMLTILGGSNNQIVVNNLATGSVGKSESLSGSLAKSDSYMRANAMATNDSNVQNNGARSHNTDIKIIKEYWIEQQYGFSLASEQYHSSLTNLRYSQIVDKLFVTDSSIFECLLTYDLLQLFCDKLSPFQDCDSCFTCSDENSLQTSIMSPNTSTSSIVLDSNSSSQSHLPSTYIEGNQKGDNQGPQVPLLEFEYRLALVKFLDYCQQASLSVLLFKDHSAQYDINVRSNEHPQARLSPLSSKLDHNDGNKGGLMNSSHQNVISNDTTSSQKSHRSPGHQRKISADMNEKHHINYDMGEQYDHQTKSREHRSSYQHDGSYNFVSSLYSLSLNHSFLETLLKRLKQMHDKELRLSKLDCQQLTPYLVRRLKQSSDIDESNDDGISLSAIGENRLETDFRKQTRGEDYIQKREKVQQGTNILDESNIEWRCFLRKGNLDNLMIVILPSSLADVSKWLDYAKKFHPSPEKLMNETKSVFNDLVCPIFAFRCSTSMINDQVLAFLRTGSDQSIENSYLERDWSMHLGQTCRYLGRMKTINDELSNEIIPPNRMSPSIQPQTAMDEKCLEIVHFKAFLRKIKNTILKSRFSSLNDAYLSEMFIHKDDILYYIDNIDMDLQKKYHVSQQLKNLTEFLRSYEEYNDSLPKELGKPCNPLLNSIVLQKCGLFINQPIARFNEANPLIRHLNDRKLLCLMRSNYEVELPILEENLANSRLIKNFIKPPTVNMGNNPSVAPHSVSHDSSGLTNSVNLESQNLSSSGLASSLTRAESNVRLTEAKCGSMGANSSGSPSMTFGDRFRSAQTPKFSSNTALNVLSTSGNESFFLEAFRGSKLCAMREVALSDLISGHEDDISLRHEAHMAAVLRMTKERKESHHYRRVLKSRSSYNQPHDAIDQALKRVDNLGRLEHFCLTPLLFSPSWRSKLAPVRDHTLEPITSRAQATNSTEGSETSIPLDLNKQQSTISDPECNSNDIDDRWHQNVCNNYIKEYEQYIQTLGFNSVQIRYPLGSKGSTGPTSMSTMAANSSSSNITMETSTKISSQNESSRSSFVLPGGSNTSAPHQNRRGSMSTSNASLPPTSGGTVIASTYNTGYLIKFLSSGCLVFKVGFCKPYVYSILYSIEGERFNDSNIKLNMTAFLDELDNIKVTMHAHSFTYDYHLRSMYSYISGRQTTFSQGYHLTSFLDDFRKYYQKPPNYARNHILSGDICINSIKVTGQQLYNYIVTHNSVYGMEVLEMSTSVLANALVSALSTNRPLDIRNIDAPYQQVLNSSFDDSNQQVATIKSHASNDYVLIELKREKIRYRDGKDPDIFDCGLMITHDPRQISTGLKDCLALRYYLLLTNQRNLYPKLVHTYDSVLSFGCHRPIRLSIAQFKQTNQLSDNQQEQEIHQEPPSGGSKKTKSVHSSDKENQSGSGTLRATSSDTDSASLHQIFTSSDETSDTQSILSGKQKRSEGENPNERTICDEQITYLGYFSSDEMDMLKFLQEKTANLRAHIEHVVRKAEIHYRRDYLWQKLMQRPSVNIKSDELPLNPDELVQLLAIVETIDLFTLDMQLSNFSLMPINWFKKLSKSFVDLKQTSNSHHHRIYAIGNRKVLLLYMDPNCTTAFILMTIDNDRGSCQLDLVLKDKEELNRPVSSKKGLAKSLGGDQHSPTSSAVTSSPSCSSIELDQDCRLLINDFINYCATFMWSTLLS